MQTIMVTWNLYHSNLQLSVPRRAFLKRSAVLPKYCNSGCNSLILGRRLILPMYGTMPGSARKGVDLTVSSIEFRVHATWSRSHGHYFWISKRKDVMQKVRKWMLTCKWHIGAITFGVGSANLDPISFVPKAAQQPGYILPGPWCFSCHFVLLLRGPAWKPRRGFHQIHQLCITPSRVTAPPLRLRGKGRVDRFLTLGNALMRQGGASFADTLMVSKAPGHREIFGW